MRNSHACKSINMAAGDDDDSGARGDLLANVSAAAFEARAKEYQAAFRSFLEACCREDVQTLHRSLGSGGGASSSMLLAAATPTASDAQQQSFAFSLRVCAQVLLDYNPSLGTLLFRHPDQFLPLFHAALAQEITSVAASATAPAATSRIYAQDAQGFFALSLKIRQKLKVRIEFLPPVNPLRKMTISTIRSNDVKQLIQIAGTVVRTGMVSGCDLCALYCSFEAACMCGTSRAKLTVRLLIACVCFSPLARSKCRRHLASTSAATLDVGIVSWSSPTPSRATSSRFR